MNEALNNLNRQLRETVSLLENQLSLLSKNQKEDSETGLSDSDRLELRRY